MHTAVMNSTWKGLMLRGCLLALLWAVALALESKLDRHWEMWKAKYVKKYQNKVEEVNRRTVWEKNLEFINVHNLEKSMGLHTYTMAMNHMGDLTIEEAKQMYANLKIPKNLKWTSSSFKATTDDLPDTVDWREKNFVTSVKDQGACGSCWAFSVVGAMEGHYFNVTGELKNLSPQQLVDCAGSYGNYGCGGGYMDKAFDYILDNGLESEADYPYEAEDRDCRYNSTKQLAKCSKYSYVKPHTESALKSAVAKVGPISVGIYADLIMFYESGIFSSNDCTGEIDHGVLVVGYGTENGQDYWLVKNSWGPGWGEHGYIRMARNKDDMCGIAEYATYCAE